MTAPKGRRRGAPFRRPAGPDPAAGRIHSARSGSNETGLPSGLPDGKSTRRIHITTAATKWQWRRAGSSNDTFVVSGFVKSNRLPRKHSQTVHTGIIIPQRFVGILIIKQRVLPNPMRFLPPKHTRKKDRREAVLLVLACRHCRHASKTCTHVFEGMQPAARIIWPHRPNSTLAG